MNTDKKLNTSQEQNSIHSTDENVERLRRRAVETSERMRKYLEEKYSYKSKAVYPNTKK